MFDIDNLQALAYQAISGEQPVLDHETGRELLNALSILNASKKIFDPTQLSNVIELDVHYEGSPLRPDSECLIISIGAGGQTRQIKIPASLSLMLIELLNEAVPRDGEDEDEDDEAD